MARQRYIARIAYDGTDFHGWQIQNPPDGPPLRTVQATVRDAMMRSLGQPIELTGASRTDAGVHALGQCAHFDADTPIPLERLAMAINARLPDDVELRHVAPTTPEFDAITDARWKRYRYRIHLGPHRPLHHRRMVSPCHYALDPHAMVDAAERLVGTHDFAGFANANHQRATTVRTIFDATVHEDRDASQLHIIVAGDGFLYHQVRIIAGTLIEIGRGHWPPQRIDAILDQADRSLAGPTAEPRGLWLEHVGYHTPPDNPLTCDLKTLQQRS